MLDEKYRIIIPNSDLESRILSLFKDKGNKLSLSDIIVLVNKGKRTPPAQIRQAIWRLIDHDRIHILNDRRLELTSDSDANI